MWHYSKVYAVEQWKDIPQEGIVHSAFARCARANINEVGYWDRPMTDPEALPLLVAAGRYIRNGETSMKPGWLLRPGQGKWTTGCLERVGERWVDFVDGGHDYLRKMFSLSPRYGTIMTALTQKGYRVSFGVEERSGLVELTMPSLYKTAIGVSAGSSVGSPLVGVGVEELVLRESEQLKFFSLRACWPQRPSIVQLDEVDNLWKLLEKKWKLPEALPVSATDIPGLVLYRDDPKAFFARQSFLRECGNVFEELTAVDWSSAAGPNLGA